MPSMDRRKFLGVAAAGSAAVSTAAASAAGLAAAAAPAAASPAQGPGILHFRAETGLPGSQANIGLPGTARLVRITKAAAAGGTLRLHGVVEDRSTLANGESARKNFVLDQANKQLRTVIAGTEMVLTLLPGTG